MATPRLLDQVRHIIRMKHYSPKTEESYVDWIKRYILYHDKRHPREMGAREIERYLSYLVTERKVAASTQNQAFHALLFLYKSVLGIQLDEKIQAVRAKRPHHLSTVRTQDEARIVITAIDGTPKLLVQLLYECGLRLMESLQLRVKDLDFGANQILIPDAKGMKDRITMLPASLKNVLQQQLTQTKAIHKADLGKGCGRVALPDALARKYPNVNSAWGWP
jgi:integrase